MNLGVLLWNTCNARCDHCAVSSGPKARPEMTDTEIFKVIDSAFFDDPEPSIGFSGGEAFVFFERLCTIVSYAIDRGAIVSINTNGYWGNRPEKATEYTRRLKAIGVARLVVSTDSFHQPYIAEKSVIEVIRACREQRIEVHLQYVFKSGGPRLADFEQRHGSELDGVSTREIAAHPVGRAAEKIAASEIPGTSRLPTEACPSAIPSISADGRVIPCCNTAGHLPSLEIGRVGDDLKSLYDGFANDPLFRVMWAKGPAELYSTAKMAGLVDPQSGYVDQCHLCHEMFKCPSRAVKLRSAASEIDSTERLAKWQRQYHVNLERNQIAKNDVAAA